MRNIWQFLRYFKTESFSFFTHGIFFSLFLSFFSFCAEEILNFCRLSLSPPPLPRTPTITATKSKGKFFIAPRARCRSSSFQFVKPNVLYIFSSCFFTLSSTTVCDVAVMVGKKGEKERKKGERKKKTRIRRLESMRIVKKEKYHFNYKQWKQR